VKTYDDLKASKKVLTFGALGNLTPTAMVPYMLADMGLPIKVVVGYVSSARIIVALEQGEVDGYFTGRGIVRAAAGSGSRRKSSTRSCRTSRCIRACRSSATCCPRATGRY
jgi:ABC-type nitrate/sulfonate/bicarbonate transport system substrate-binding protein